MRASRDPVDRSRGQIGSELKRLLAASGEVVAVDRRMLDLADPDAIVASCAV
jgi:dTDP-4-dehydrorhamnose reductase